MLKRITKFLRENWNLLALESPWHGHKFALCSTKGIGYSLQFFCCCFKSRILAWLQILEKQEKRGIWIHKGQNSKRSIWQNTSPNFWYMVQKGLTYMLKVKKVFCTLSFILIVKLSVNGPDSIFHANILFRIYACVIVSNKGNFLV